MVPVEDFHLARPRRFARALDEIEQSTRRGVPDNKININAEFGVAIERFRIAWKAYADTIKPDKVEKEKELDHDVLERLDYYNDPENPRHPDIIKSANEIRADMLLFDSSSVVTGPKSVLTARVAVDERLEILTAELRRVLEALPALPPLTIESLTKITPADVGAWTAIRTEAEKKAVAAATEGIVLAHAFAALLEASVDASISEPTPSSTMSVTRRYGLTRSLRQLSSL
jgi:hypothetical protein